MGPKTLTQDSMKKPGQNIPFRRLSKCLPFANNKIQQVAVRYLGQIKILYGNDIVANSTNLMFEFT